MFGKFFNKNKKSESSNPLVKGAPSAAKASMMVTGMINAVSALYRQQEFSEEVLQTSIGQLGFDYKMQKMEDGTFLVEFPSTGIFVCTVVPFEDGLGIKRVLTSFLPQLAERVQLLAQYDKGGHLSVILGCEEKFLSEGEKALFESFKKEGITETLLIINESI